MSACNLRTALTRDIRGSPKNRSHCHHIDVLLDPYCQTENICHSSGSGVRDAHSSAEDMGIQQRATPWKGVCFQNLSLNCGVVTSV